MANIKTKNEKLFSYLRKTGKVTAEQAEKKFGVKNLRARISDLRNEEGWEITSERNPKNKRTVVYKLVSAS